MLRAYKIHTMHGIIEFTGDKIKESPKWHWYDTDTGAVFKFRKEHIIMVEEGKSIEGMPVSHRERQT